MNAPPPSWVTRICVIRFELFQRIVELGRVHAGNAESEGRRADLLQRIDRKPGSGFSSCHPR